MLATPLRRAAVLRDLVGSSLRPPPLPADPPLVTVIIPTYNFSAALRHAIRSVLWQTYENFELLVVGDGCTDDSEEVTRSFGDPRVVWMNLPENEGTQSAPNNAGLAVARGRYTAYMGHDDLWHPWHLATLVGVLERTGAAWAHSLLELIGPVGSRMKFVSGLAPGDRPLGQRLCPMVIMHRTEPGRQLGWRHHSVADESTDLDFFDRMQGLNGPPIRVRALTGFKLVSSWRPGIYRRPRGDEQAEWARRIERDRWLLQRELVSLVLHRLSPWHARMPDEPERPPDAPRGWRSIESRRVRGLEEGAAAQRPRR
jgi:hypothetical protein